MKKKRKRKDWLALVDGNGQRVHGLSCGISRKKLKILLTDEVEVWEGEALEFMGLPHMPRLLEVLKEKYKRRRK